MAKVIQDPANCRSAACTDWLRIQADARRITLARELDVTRSVFLGPARGSNAKRLRSLRPLGDQALIADAVFVSGAVG